MASNKKTVRNEDSLLYRQLTRLFSGPIVNYRAQTQRRFRKRQLDKKSSIFKSAGGLEFKKSDNSNIFQGLNADTLQGYDRIHRYSDFDQMEYCLHGDTKIAVPGGYKTLKELEAEYGTTESFIVYSYDHNKGEVVPALGKQSRKTTTDHAWKVTFENGQEIIGTANHRLMLRDGTYRRIDQLEEGAAMMPFYRKDLINSKDDTGEGYRWIYSMHNDPGRRPGWKAEHIMIAEWVSDRRMLENEVVHHKNFVKNDNNPENLAIMDNSDHLRLHQKVLNDQRKDTGWWDTFRKNHSAWMKENNPAERKDITYEKILYLCDVHGYNQKNICSILDTDPNTIKRRLRSKGFSNFENFAKTYDPTWANTGQDNRDQKNPRYDETLTFQAICEAYENGMSSAELARTLGTTYMKIKNRLKKNGYENYSGFKTSYGNHKVAKIEYYGQIDLYDLTVDGYKNFATDTVISHNTPEIASSLDIYADEITTSTRISPLLTIESHNQEIKDILDALYHKVLNIDHNLFGWARTTCKYGDFFLYLDIDDEAGVQSVLGLPTNEIERLEGEDKTNPNYVQYQWNAGGLTFEQWQIGHFRILGNDRYAPYGTSVLEPSRRIWRQLTLLEDAMMAYRITRSPERRVFYFDVGTIPSDDIEQFIEKAKTQLKRNQVVDPNTGRVDLRYNPLSIDEDYYIPVRGGANNTRIDTLSGGQFTGDIDDVKYLRDKLFAGLKIPASYLSRGEGADEDKTTLAQKDIRFARTIQRIQRAIVTEIEKIGIVHLYTLGFRDEDLVSFKLHLNNPSKIAELQELEHWKVKFDTASGATEKFFSRRWVAKNIFSLSDEEYQRNQREMYYDAWFDASLEQVAEGVASEAEAALGGGDLGDGMGDDMGGDDLGLDDMGGDDAGDDAGDDDSALLAAPAKRDTDSTKGGKLTTTTPKSNGRYVPKNVNGVAQEGGDQRKAGARQRHTKGLWNNEITKPVKRNTHKGYSELAGLPGLNLTEDTNYDVEEEKLLRVGAEVRNLISHLEMKDERKEE